MRLRGGDSSEVENTNGNVSCQLINLYIVLKWLYARWEREKKEIKTMNFCAECRFYRVSEEVEFIGGNLVHRCQHTLAIDPGEGLMAVVMR